VNIIGEGGAYQFKSTIDIERVWRITRKERTHNRYFDEVFILRDTLIKYFEQFIEPNLKLFTLCSNYNNL
jgi:hypothetical protein